MRSFGAGLFGMGVLSYVLPLVGLQFKLITALEQIHPNVGMFFIVAGAILFGLGLLFGGPARQSGSKVLVKVDNTAPDHRPSGFGRFLGFLIALGILIGGGYYAETKYNVSTKVKTWVETEWPKIKKEIEKEMDKGSQPPGAGTGDPTKAIEPVDPSINPGGSTTSQPGEPKGVDPGAAGTDPVGGVHISGPFGGNPRTVVIDD